MPSQAIDSSDVRPVFLADHRRLEALIERLIAAFEANDREGIQDLWARFETGLLAHLDAEERVLIPALRSADAAEADALLRDHEHFRSRVAELGAGIDLHIVRLETARTFVSELLQHAKREDDALYGWSDLHLAEPVRATLLEDFRNKMRRASREVFHHGEAR